MKPTKTPTAPTYGLWRCALNYARQALRLFRQARQADRLGFRDMARNVRAQAATAHRMARSLRREVDYVLMNSGPERAPC